MAAAEREAVLTKLNEKFPEAEHSDHLDEDLVRPWNEACKAADANDQAGHDLRVVLLKVQNAIGSLQEQWKNAFANAQEGFSPQARHAIEKASTIPPPSAGTHWLIRLWQNKPEEWHKLLASNLYQRDRNKNFVFHAFGETLCNIKAASFPSRNVTNDILATYRVNQKMVARLTAREELVAKVEDDPDPDELEYEGAEVIGSLLASQGGLEYGDDFDDGMSVE